MTREAASSLLVGLAAIVAALSFLVLDPAGPTALAWQRGALGGGAALAGLLGAAGAGGALLQRLAPDLLGDERGLLHATVLGLLLWGLLGLLLAAPGLLSPTVARALPALLAAGWLARPALRLPRPPAVALLIGAVVLLPGMVDALAPPVDTDELYQHLALPSQILAEGRLVGGLLHPDGSRPQGLHLVYASLLALGGEEAPRLFHLLLAALCLEGTRQVAQAWLGRGGEVAALLLAASASFLQTAGLAANDLPAALAALAALDAGLRGRALPLALASGLALGIKYTAGGAVAGAFLAARLPWRRRVLAGLGALLLVSPWWLRNAVEGLHPLFPFAGWSPAPLHPDAPGAQGLRFQYLEKYGAGRDLAAMLALPWNAVMTARLDGFRFLGRLSPAFLALLPGALLAALPWNAPRPLARRLLLAALAPALFWALGPHWLRYLLPGLPLLALALAAGLPADTPAGPPRLSRRLVLLCLLAGLPANLGPLLQRAADRLPAALGHEDRDRFQARLHPPSASVAWANRHLPQDAVVALLFDWSTALVERPTLLGSVEDHVPARHWLLTRGRHALDDLRAAGATHLLVGSVRFLPSVYPFLSESERQATMQAPQEQLEALLLTQATLIHQQGGTRIYRLDSPPSP